MKVIGYTVAKGSVSLKFDNGLVKASKISRNLLHNDDEISKILEGF